MTDYPETTVYRPKNFIHCKNNYNFYVSQNATSGPSPFWKQAGYPL